MSYSAAIACDNTTPQPIGIGAVDRALVTNLAGSGMVYLYSNNPAFTGTPSDAEKVAIIVATGTPMAAGEKLELLGTNGNGIDLSAYFLACDTGITANVRILA